MPIVSCPNCKVKIDTKTGKVYFDNKPVKGNQLMKGLERDEKGRLKSKKKKRSEEEEIKETVEDKDLKKEIEEIEPEESIEEDTGALDFF